jgi:hypothetical protein
LQGHYDNNGEHPFDDDDIDDADDIDDNCKVIMVTVGNTHLMKMSLMLVTSAISVIALMNV